jgi:hypothetical protein
MGNPCRVDEKTPVLLLLRRRLLDGGQQRHGEGCGDVIPARRRKEVYAIAAVIDVYQSSVLLQAQHGKRPTSRRRASPCARATVRS